MKITILCEKMLKKCKKGKSKRLIIVRKGIGYRASTITYILTLLSLNQLVSELDDLTYANININIINLGRYR